MASSAAAAAVLSEIDPEQAKLMGEQCILVDTEDKITGGASKIECHLWESIDKYLHRAFSVFLFHPTTGKLLLQRRADSKATFAGMWTNTCCSHPLVRVPLDGEYENVKPGEEELEQDGVRGATLAASRKLIHEFNIRGIDPSHYQYLTKLLYIARNPSHDPKLAKWGEHEMDYILVVTHDPAGQEATPNVKEIGAHKWVTKAELQDMFADPHLRFTPWFRLIAERFLYSWWDELLASKGTGETYDAKVLAHVEAEIGTKIHDMRTPEQFPQPTTV